MAEAGRADFSAMLKMRSVPAEEPIFFLRAQDAAAAPTVRAWAAISFDLGTPPAVLEQALAQADAMEAWPTKKPADADHLSEGEAKRLTYEFTRRAWADRSPAPTPEMALAEQRGATPAAARAGQLERCLRDAQLALAHRLNPIEVALLIQQGLFGPRCLPPHQAERVAKLQAAIDALDGSVPIV